jgi:hypothetical protein
MAAKGVPACGKGPCTGRFYHPIEQPPERAPNKIETHSLGITLGIPVERPGKTCGQHGDDSWTDCGSPGDGHPASWGRTRGQAGDTLGTAWGRPRPGPATTAGAVPAGENLRKTRGQPGDDMRMTCGDRIAVPSAARAVHRRCTAPVDRDPRSHLREHRLSTLSTAPTTSTALLLYSKKDPAQIRAWGQRAPSARAEAERPHPRPTPAGGGSP